MCVKGKKIIPLDVYYATPPLMDRANVRQRDFSNGDLRAQSIALRF